MAVNHPAVKKRSNAQWRDIHFANDEVRCTRYEVVPRAGTVTAQLADVGGAVAAVLADAFENDQPLRVPGGRWSLSTIGKPKSTLLDLSNYRRIGRVAQSWLNLEYAAYAEQTGVAPMLIAGGTSVNTVNSELAKLDLALKTSGASDGQSLAGAMATGTHGADLKVGAFHDTVLAVHLVVSPTRSVLIQEDGGPFVEKSAKTLGKWFGIECELLTGDNLFRAAQVHLGSLGVVLNLIVEATPLYYLARQRTPHLEGASWRAVLTSRRPKNANGLHFADPDCLAIIVHPYAPFPETEPRAWITSMRKTRYDGEDDVITEPTDESLKSDLADFLPGIVALFENDIELPGNPALRALTSAQLRNIYGSNAVATKALPGAMFGPPDFLGIDFDPIQGASAEYVFNATQARAGVERILDTLVTQASQGNQYLGGIGVRFVKGSDALLAPNAAALNCFVELQGLYTDELPAIHTAVGRALTQAGIPYCGHWGQWEMNTPTVAKRWWGAEALTAWKVARNELLPTTKAKKIFASPILRGAGLE